MPHDLPTVLAHAPVWVWALLAGLTALGLRQTRARQMGRAAALLPPAVLAGLSFVAAETSFGRPAACAAAWVGAAGAAWALARAARWPAGVHWDTTTARVAMPGSWVPLGLYLALFGLRFAVGAALALQWPVTAAPGFGPAMAALYGAFSGLFIARGEAAWRAVPQVLGRLRQPAAHPPLTTP